jgi:hypothetical protein
MVQEFQNFFKDEFVSLFWQQEHQPAHALSISFTCEVLRFNLRSNENDHQQQKGEKKEKKREQAENYQWMVILGLTKLVTWTTIVSPSWA